MVDCEENSFPMALASFLSSSGENVGGVFLIDTASRHNILNERILPVLNEECLDCDGRVMLTAFADECVEGREVHLDFCLGDCHFHEPLYVAPGLNLDSIYPDHVILGILGVDFLLKYGLTLDFVSNALYFSGGIENENLKDCYSFPLGYGLTYYGLPVVVMSRSGREYVSLLDSGSNLNAVSAKVIDEGDKAIHNSGAAAVTSIAAIRTTNITSLNFDLMGILPDMTNLCKYGFSSDFHLISSADVIIEGSDDIPPVSMLVGAEFLRGNACILDFGSRYVFWGRNPLKHNL